MNNVQSKDTGYYWCSVEINSQADEKQYFWLQVTKGLPELYVENQMVTGTVGSNLEITCFHNYQTTKKWCKLDGKCVKGEMDHIDGASVKVINSGKQLKVNMSNLEMKHSGWYHCSAGDLQMPVHITMRNYSVNEITPHIPDRPPEETFSKWLIILVVVVTVVVTFAVILIILLKQKCRFKPSFEQNRSENLYISMDRRTSKCGDKQSHNEDPYEFMSNVKTADYEDLSTSWKS
ncbi:polymeric immunoglobulin receptor [Hoplias malabaricus]|uniref:polymeric immunoglobulin receptor n=1 Tax=Hoplias malabaricus TaxID=27720 RepID=UPI003462001F